jgi:hypothetical protein
MTVHRGVMGIMSLVDYPACVYMRRFEMTTAERARWRKQPMTKDMAEVTCAACVKAWNEGPGDLVYS